MMGRQASDQSQLFYLFNLEERIPANHLLRRINPVVTQVLADLREKLAPLSAQVILVSKIAGRLFGLEESGPRCSNCD